MVAIKWTPNESFQKNKKLLFVFGIPKNLSLSEWNNLKEENTMHQDMIIPGILSDIQWFKNYHDKFGKILNDYQDCKTLQNL